MLAIETKSLTKQYGERRVVDDISFEVEQGKVFGFLGPNGAGKTTTIRILLNLIRPNAGTASILGMNVATEFTKIAHKIAAVVETPTYFPNLTAIQTLKTFSNYSGVERSKGELLSILDSCGILYAASQNVDNFSLGMKQRLALASSLINDPEIIFLDEPTNGLDPDGILKIRSFIRYLAQEQKKTIFVTSHLLAEVEQICDEVLILSHGQVKIKGQVSDLLAGSGVCIRAFPLDTVQRVLENAYPESLLVRKDNMSEIEIKIDRNEIPNLIRNLVNENVEINEVFVRSRTLEDLFHQVLAT